MSTPRWKLDRLGKTRGIHTVKGGFYKEGREIAAKLTNPSGHPPRVIASIPVRTPKDWLRWWNYITTHEYEYEFPPLDRRDILTASRKRIENRS